jgi:N-acetylglucosaminyldiphosphoundecaprenol N-acetyl-beta-D-mannosaminyltransferase
MSSIMSNLNENIKKEKVVLLGVKIDVLALDQLLCAIESCLTNQSQTIISYANVHAVNIAYSFAWFRDFLNQSDLTFCDGIGIKLAARFTGQRLNYRYTPPDFMDYICEIAVRLNRRIFFLGANPGTVERAANRLVRNFPALQIQSHHGYFDKTAGGQENQWVIEQINEFQPQILVVGFGMPGQEKWIQENSGSLDVCVIMSAGALFEYLSGDLPRAPRWMTDHGLEWIGRLLIEPRRLWKRYIIGIPLFFWRIFIHHFLGYPLPR